MPKIAVCAVRTTSRNNAIQRRAERGKYWQAADLILGNNLIINAPLVEGFRSRFIVLSTDSPNYQKLADDLSRYSQNGAFGCRCRSIEPIRSLRSTYPATKW